jgi:hypothetical protein
MNAFDDGTGMATTGKHPWQEGHATARPAARPACRPPGLRNPGLPQGARGGTVLSHPRRNHGNDLTQ